MSIILVLCVLCMFLGANVKKNNACMSYFWPYYIDLTEHYPLILILLK